MVLLFFAVSAFVVQGRLFLFERLVFTPFSVLQLAEEGR